MNYSEKLKNPQWQRRRLQVLERDEWKCHECGEADKTLHVHHRFYITGREPWEYLPFALVSLCESCHDKGHKKASIQPWEILLTEIFYGADSADLTEVECKKISDCIRRFREANGSIFELSRLLTAACEILEEDKQEAEAEA